MTSMIPRDDLGGSFSKQRRAKREIKAKQLWAARKDKNSFKSKSQNSFLDRTLKAVISTTTILSFGSFVKICFIVFIQSFLAFPFFSSLFLVS